MSVSDSTSQRGVGSRRVVFDSLNGLRFLLAAWIAFYHFGHMYDDAGFGQIALLKAGLARADVFFILSGFVLTHVYWNRTSKPFNFLDFLVARLSRIYPLYLLAMVLIAGYVIAGSLVGMTPDSGYSVKDFIASAVFLQAFGLTDTNDWNFPAWAMSAQMGGYLLFPLFLWLADRFKKLPWLMLILALALIVLADLASRHVLGLALNQFVTDWAVLRGAIMVFCGVAARVAYTSFFRGPESSLITVFAGTVALLAAAYNGWGLAAIGFTASMLFMGLARLDHMDEWTPLNRPIMRRAGELSYAIFILHAPIFSLTYGALGVIGIDLQVTWLTSFLMTALVILIAIPATYWIAHPAQRWIRYRWDNMRERSLA